MEKNTLQIAWIKAQCHYLRYQFVFKKKSIRHFDMQKRIGKFESFERLYLFLLAYLT